MAKKVIRKRIPIGTDEFVTSRSRFFRYLSDNFKSVVIVSSIAAVLFLSYTGWLIYSRQRDQKAGDALYAAVKVFQAKVDPAGTTPDTFKTEEEKNRAAINKLVEVSKHYRGSNIEPIALLYAADAYYKLKEFEKAIELYGRLLSGEVKDPSLHGNIMAFKLNPGILRDSAIYGLAFSYEQKGELKKAMDSMLFLTSSKDTHLEELALMSLGRLYEKSNERGKALETYQRIISEYPESPNLTVLKEKVGRLKG
jgi:tetratricopeptide (TPR) repeat protein